MFYQAYLLYVAPLYVKEPGRGKLPSICIEPIKMARCARQWIFFADHLMWRDLSFVFYCSPLFSIVAVIIWYFYQGVSL